MQKLGLFDDDIVYELLKIAQVAEGYFLKYGAIDALVAIGEKGIPIIQKVFLEENHKRHVIATKVLSQISSVSVKILINSMKTGKFRDSLESARALGEAHAYVDIVEPALLDVIDSKKITYIALFSIKNLECKSDHLIKTLGKVIQDPTYDELTRNEAMDIILERKFTNPEIIEALKNVSLDKNSNLAKKAKELLKILGFISEN